MNKLKKTLEKLKLKKMSTRFLILGLLCCGLANVIGYNNVGMVFAGISTFLFIICLIFMAKEFLCLSKKKSDSAKEDIHDIENASKKRFQIARDLVKKNKNESIPNDVCKKKKDIQDLTKNIISEENDAPEEEEKVVSSVIEEKPKKRYRVIDD